VLLLDEVDKMSSDFRGDPAAALLEVLDPEQNYTFSDHYLEVEFDLSEVMFITTANVTHTIPPLSRTEWRSSTSRVSRNGEGEDRAELPRPRMLSRHGLKPTDIRLNDAAIRSIIQLYTREAGVRNLERELSKILRKVAVGFASTGKAIPVSVTPTNVTRYLGVPHYLEKEIPPSDPVGVVTGLAWTSSGGDILRIEVGFMPGTGKFSLTGLLGDMMKESAQIALTYARGVARVLPLKKNFFNEIDVHIHVPEGAIPKDGPSAGIAMATALVSNFFGIPVKKDIAMTENSRSRAKCSPWAVSTRRPWRRCEPESRKSSFRRPLPKHQGTPQRGAVGLKIHTVSDMREVLKLALTRPFRAPAQIRETRDRA